jgi:hypothetical protein
MYGQIVHEMEDLKIELAATGAIETETSALKI